MENRAPFRKLDGTIIENVEEYVKEYLIKHKDELPTGGSDGTAIYIGCDSQAYRDKIRYSTVICLRRAGKGLHIIRKVEVIKATKDAFTKLWNESVYSMNTAEQLVSGGYITPDQITVHVDYNPSPEFPSHKLYDAGLGFFKSAGYHVAGKPEAWAASHVADKGAKGK